MWTQPVSMMKSCAVVAALLFATVPPAPAQEARLDALYQAKEARLDALYQAKVSVTGQREANRLVAFGDCLGQVLVKLSGDPAVITDARYAEIAANAAALVQGFSYRDLLAYRPIHDEQGTYDRPYELTVTFDHARLDDTVRALGRTPWLAPRPRVVVVLAVENVTGAFALSADGTADRSADMREALAAAAERVGLAVALPAQAELAARRIGAAQMPPPPVVMALAHDGDVVLAGHIAFSESALSWIEDWRLDLRDRHVTWNARNETFDEAFRAALRGTIQVLAGTGTSP